VSGSGRGRGADRAEASIGEYHRVLTFVSLALLGSVALMVGGAWALVATGAFQPFLGLRLPVRIGVGVFLIVLLAAAYPLSRAVGSGNRPETREEALARVQTRVTVGMAVRDAVGAMAAVLILLAGDIVLGGTVGALVLVSMAAALPRRDQLEEAVRGLPPAV
jgi:hypothetical protein